MAGKYIFLIVSSFIVLSFILSPALAASSSVYLEDLTWMEIRDRITGGTTVVIVPTGGTEQNGPHAVLGKHNTIVRYASGEIAKRLGNALAAPVIPYSPAGRIEPPEGHMQFAGTISLSETVFAAVLEDTARSLKQHGFKLICFIGDHGGNQQAQRQVAEKLTAQWEGQGVRVLQVSNYYENNGQERWAQSVGIKVPDILAHAGLVDTSELMSLDPGGVRDSQRGRRTEMDYRATGAMGDSSQASANYGRRFVSLKIEAAVEQIRNAFTRAQ